MAKMAWRIVSGNVGQALVTSSRAWSGVSGLSPSLSSGLSERSPSAVAVLSPLGTGGVSSPADSEVMPTPAFSCVLRWLDTSGHDVSPPVFFGLPNAPGRIRTCDLRIRNPLLYPAELRAQFIILQYVTS